MKNITIVLLTLFYFSKNSFAQMAKVSTIPHSALQQYSSPRNAVISNDSIQKSLTSLKNELDSLRKAKHNSPLAKGLKITAKDSSYAVKFGFRFQNLMLLESQSDNLEKIDARIMTRRARLKFDGFVFSPNIEYKMEIGISNGDIGSPVKQGGNASNLMYDAVVKWKFAPNTTLWFGQTKLPGNRERVVSSQALQFVDRSLLNADYNLDRDVGFQLHHHFKLGKVIIRDIYALSMGEGRNITTKNPGLDYTARIEILPFGDFTKKGDYVSSDIYREKSPKLSIGLTYDYNDDASKERGQLGNFLPQTTDLKTIFADLMFKYRGFSILSEYADKSSTNPAVYNNEGILNGAFVVGKGISVQSGYLFKSNWEVAARYTHIDPVKGLGRESTWMYTLGLSRYIVGHNLKFQTDISLVDEEFSEPHGLMFRLQTEVAF